MAKIAGKRRRGVTCARGRGDVRVTARSGFLRHENQMPGLLAVCKQTRLEEGGNKSPGNSLGRPGILHAEIASRVAAAEQCGLYQCLAPAEANVR